MAPGPESPSTRGSALRVHVGTLAVGALLGLLQIAPALGLSGPWSPTARVLGTVALLGLLYVLWRRLHGVWTALASGHLAGVGYYGVALHWLGSSSDPDPSTFALGEVVLTAGALCLFVPWWALWFAGGRVLARIAGTEAATPVAFVGAFAAADVLLGDH